MDYFLSPSFFFGFGNMGFLFFFFLEKEFFGGEKALWDCHDTPVFLYSDMRYCLYGRSG